MVVLLFNLVSYINQNKSTLMKTIDNAFIVHLATVSELPVVPSCIVLIRDWLVLTFKPLCNTHRSQGDPVSAE